MSKKIALLAAASVLGTTYKAGSVLLVDDVLAKHLVDDGSADANEAAVAHRESEGEEVHSLVEPAADPNPDPEPKGKKSKG